MLFFVIIFSLEKSAKEGAADPGLGRVVVALEFLVGGVFVPHLLFGGKAALIQLFQEGGIALGKHGIVGTDEGVGLVEPFFVVAEAVEEGFFGLEVGYWYIAAEDGGSDFDLDERHVVFFV
jgi:hypothetical protein